MVGVAVEVFVGSGVAAGFGGVVLAAKTGANSRVSVGSGVNRTACLPPQAVTENSIDANISRFALGPKLSKTFMIKSPTWLVPTTSSHPIKPCNKYYTKKIIFVKKLINCCV